MAISWEGCFSNKERKKYENNGKQYPVWFKVIVDINGYSVRNSRCILIPDMKAFDLQWHPGNVYNFCWFSSGREPSSVRRKFSLEVLTRVSDIGRTWIKKIICLLIFPMLYCQVRLSTVTPIITKISSSVRGIRQLQIVVRLTSQWSGKCAVKWIKTTNKRQWEILFVSLNSRCVPKSKISFITILIYQMYSDLKCHRFKLLIYAYNRVRSSNTTLHRDRGYCKSEVSLPIEIKSQLEWKRSQLEWKRSGYD